MLGLIFQWPFLPGHFFRGHSSRERIYRPPVGTVTVRFENSLIRLTQAFKPNRFGQLWFYLSTLYRRSIRFRRRRAPVRVFPRKRSSVTKSSEILTRVKGRVPIGHGLFCYTCMQKRRRIINCKPFKPPQRAPQRRRSVIYNGTLCGCSTC